jgi:phosphohistidine phosphatase
VLLRHAKAESGGLNDQQRELAQKGQNQAKNLAKSFASAGVKPELAIVSSAVRTQQTWALAAAGKPKFKGETDVLETIYGASVADVLAVLRVVKPKYETVVVVGHEPTMAACAAFLAGPLSDESAKAQVKLGMPTASWALLESMQPWEDWGSGTAVLRSVIRPASSAS